MKLANDYILHRLMPFRNIHVEKKKRIKNDVFQNFKDGKNEKLASISFTKDFARSNLFSLGTNQ